MLTLDYIRNQRKKGYAPIVLFVGRQRVGKTSMAMRFAYELDKKWSLDLMTFKIEDFVKIYDKHKRKIIILDEASVPLDPYEHQSITQRVYKHVIDTQAYLGNIVFLVLPFAKGIGKQHRDHVNIIVHVKARGFYTAKAVLSRHDDLSFQTPFSWIIEEVGDVPLPPPHIFDRYKNEFQEHYKKTILETQVSLLFNKLNPVQKKKPVSVL